MLHNNPLRGNKSILCIYHANCPDGFASAYVAWLFARQSERSITFLPASYGDEIPLIDMIEDKDVFILDFSYSPVDICNIAYLAHTVTLLDHHISALNTIDDWLNADNRFPFNVEMQLAYENENSGVGLAWEYFFPLADMPLVLQHIQDRDLWKFDLSNTKAICAAISSYPMEFDLMESLCEDTVYALLLTEGNAILRYKEQKIKEICLNAFMIEHEGNKVLTANCPSFLSSEVGNELSKGFPYSVTFSVIGDRTKYSLRSDRDTDIAMDVSVIAKNLGGGGHKNAAGYEVKNLIVGKEEER